jgi:hypothetical protein
MNRQWRPREIEDGEKPITHRREKYDGNRASAVVIQLGSTTRSLRGEDRGLN